MEQEYFLSSNRKFTEEEQRLIWEKPMSHKTSEEEIRICKEVKRNWHRGEMKIANILLEGDAGSGKTQLAKALSADFGIPYTKVTCFADMDKSDIIGAILPVISEEKLDKMGREDKAALEALYESDGLHSATEVLVHALCIPHEEAAGKIKYLMELAGGYSKHDIVEYRFYPSEIVRAYRNGYLLEIQEPTVIRDAAVLMALNSALELDGSINLPTEIVHRHPDCIVIITTNRNYLGCRPLNESLRDRIQHTEKMDLPSKDIMIERAIAKTGYENLPLLEILADTIIILDQTAKANSIKGVAGMRSFFYWVDAIASGAAVEESLYHKVLYKITTDSDEIKILEEALKAQNVLEKLWDIENNVKKKTSEVAEIKTWGKIEEEETPNCIHKHTEEDTIALRKAPDSEDNAYETSDEMGETKSANLGADGTPKYHQLNTEELSEEQKEESEFRKKLNKEARKAVSNSIHRSVKTIVHRPEWDLENKEEYLRFSKDLLPIIMQIAKKTTPLLEHEISTEFAKTHYYGNQFQADHIAYKDFRYFSKKLPPNESPSLAVGLRVDESASMSSFGRLEAAKSAVIAVYEFCHLCNIPILVYGDTADTSKIEQMSIFAYSDFEKDDYNNRYRLMGIRGRSNNRDGMALRILAEKLMSSPQQTKLLISISDGQPKAMEDYTGKIAMEDMKKTIAEYERKGITFLAAAIGQDKEVISQIYKEDRFLDITNLEELPGKLVKIIARYL